MLLTLPSPVRTFVHDHDDLPAFHAAYLLAAICAAVFFDAGALLLLIAVHMSFDVCKYREREGLSMKATLKATIRESVVDFALIAITLTFAVYLHHAIELIAVFGGFLHAEVSVLRALATVVPQFLLSKRLLDVPFKGHPQFLRARKHLSPFTILEWTAMGSLVFCVFLLLVAPMLLSLTMADEMGIIVEHVTL
jgi:hypothetical protein